MVSGEGRDCCCQPEDVSEANVAEASNWPEALQMCPICWPVSLLDFQKRIAVIWPATLLVNSVPSSKGPTWTLGRAGVWVVNRVCDWSGEKTRSEKQTAYVQPPVHILPLLPLTP